MTLSFFTDTNRRANGGKEGGTTTTISATCERKCVLKGQQPARSSEFQVTTHVHARSSLRHQDSGGASSYRDSKVPELSKYFNEIPSDERQPACLPACLLARLWGQARKLCSQQPLTFQTRRRISRTIDTRFNIIDTCSLTLRYHLGVIYCWGPRSRGWICRWIFPFV